MGRPTGHTFVSARIGFFSEKSYRFFFVDFSVFGVRLRTGAVRIRGCRIRLTLEKERLDTLRAVGIVKGDLVIFVIHR